MFAAWSGEELGTLGSSHFTEQLAGPGDLKGKAKGDSTAVSSWLDAYNNGDWGPGHCDD